MAEPSSKEPTPAAAQITADNLLELLGVTTESQQSRRSVWLVPAIAGLLGLLLTAGVVIWKLNDIAKDNQEHFTHMTQRVEREIKRRVLLYSYGLMGTRSVFASSEQVTRDEFHAMAKSRDIQNEFPGALGIGFIRRVGRDDLPAFLERTRKDNASDFTVNSNSNIGPLYIIEYIHPLASNREALGFDIAQEARRREAANRAMASNQPAITTSISLVQNGAEGPGFLYMLPVYKNGMPTQTAEERMQALDGWVFMPIVASRLFKGITDIVNKEIDFEVFDSTEMSSDSLVYDDDGHISHHQGAVTTDQFTTRDFSRFETLSIGGKDLLITFSDTDRFKHDATNIALGIAITGILLSSGLTIVLFTLGSTVQRARALAQSMTKDLQRLALVAENTNNLVIITDKDRKFEWVNKGFTKLTGYTLEEIKGKSPGSLLQTPQTDPVVVQTVRDALNEGRGCRVELLNKTKAGQEYVLDMEIQPLHDDTGQITGFISVETDVTEKVTARNRLESIFRAMAEGLLVQSKDGSIVDCNPEAERILGLPREQILGSITTANKWRCVRENGEEWPVHEHPIYVTLTTGKPARNTVMGVYLADGNLHWISLNTQAIMGADGQVLSAISTFADISDRIIARNELDLKERTLRTMFNQSRQFAGTVSTQGVLLDANKTALDFAGIAEKDKNQVIGKYFWDGPWWSHDPELQEWLKTAIASAANGQSIRRQTIHVDPKGQTHHVDFSITPVVDKDGKVMMLIPEGWDITESKIAADALRQARDAADLATRSKSEFLANMSHEIRTPMTAILGYTDLLAEEWDKAMNPRQRLEYIATIKRNGEHLLSIINDILDLSKIETGKMTVESIQTNPDQLVFDVVSLMSVKAKAKGISLNTQYDTAIPQTIMSDPLRLRQILVNLVGNAIKFTEVGSVTIRVKLDKNGLEGSRLNFEIHDTGIGLTKPQVNKLFGAFEQADATTTRKFGGTGLGLRISKRLAEILGGDITVTSQPDKGSVFTLRISTGPLDNVAIIMPNIKPEVVRDSNANQTNKKLAENLLQDLKILMVEDGPDNQRLIAHHLRKAGAIVTTADNGEVAVKSLTTDKTVDGPINPKPGFNLILMDMQMPVMDGYTATKLLRNKGCTLPIIALTAHAMAGDTDRCLDAGCDDYTAKPIDRDKLISLCAAWINKDRSFHSSDIFKAGSTTPPLPINAQIQKPETTDNTPAAQPEPEKPSKPIEKLKSTFHEDKSMAGLIADFVGKLPQRAEHMQSLLRTNQFDELTRMAHQMAGAAGSYGYPSITQAARIVEKLAQDRPADLQALTQSCDKVQQLCLMATAGLN